MPSYDYHVLRLVDATEGSLASLEQCFVDGGYDGVAIQVKRGSSLSDVAFLTDLPGLRFVELSGVVLDDRAVFTLPGIEEAVLLTRCQQPVPVDVSASIRRIGLDDRPGLPNIGRLSQLLQLKVWLWQGTDLQFLNGASSLVGLHVEGKNQVTSLTGLDGLSRLEEVELLDLGVESLAPLSEAVNLRRLWLIGPQAGATAPLDLADLSGAARLEELRINGGSLRSLASVSRWPNLRDVRIIGATRIMDNDLTPLDALPDSVRVVSSKCSHVGPTG